MVRARASAKDANKREKSIEKKKKTEKGNPIQGKIQWNILTLNNLAYLSGMSVPILVSLDGSSESDEKLISLGSAACLRDAQALLTSNHMLYEGAAPLIVSRARRFWRRLIPSKTPSLQDRAQGKCNTTRHTHSWVRAFSQQWSSRRRYHAERPIGGFGLFIGPNGSVSSGVQGWL